MANLVLRTETPETGEYCAMRVATGLSAKTAEAASRGLPNSLFAVCLREADGTLIGMGRIIGDGGLNFEIVDIAVHPDHQRAGHGYRIMEALMEWIHEHAPPSSFVCLIADHGAPALYAKFGFEFTAPVSVAMAYRP